MGVRGWDSRTVGEFVCRLYPNHTVPFQEFSMRPVDLTEAAPTRTLRGAGYEQPPDQRLVAVRAGDVVRLRDVVASSSQFPMGTGLPVVREREVWTLRPGSVVEVFQSCTHEWGEVASVFEDQDGEPRVWVAGHCHMCGAHEEGTEELRCCGRRMNLEDDPNSGDGYAWRCWVCGASRSVQWRRGE